MLDIKNPEIDVETLVRAIQAKAQERRMGPPPDSAAPGDFALEQGLRRAIGAALVGADVPEMSRTRGLARLVARPVAKGFLRIAQLITRDQRTFNLASLDVLRALYDRSAELLSLLAAARAEIATLRGQLEQVESAVSRLDSQIGQLRAARTDPPATVATDRGP